MECDSFVKFHKDTSFSTHSGEEAYMNVLIELQNDHMHYTDLISDLEKDFRHLQNGVSYDVLQIIMTLYPLKLDMEVHFAREEYALFSCVAHPIIPVLIEEHITLRKTLKDLDIMVSGVNSGEIWHEQNQIDKLKKLMDSFRSLRDSHILKEETILFPYLLNSINKWDWKLIQKKFKEFNNIVAVNLL